MFEVIDMMLLQARESLENLRGQYQTNLEAQEISILLRNHVRRLLADLRDPLDHIYQLIPEVSVSGTFPTSNSAAQFTNQTAKLDPDIVAVIRQFQSFDSGNVWLKRFSALSNIHKHLELIPQIRTERKVVSVTPTSQRTPSQGGSLTFRPGGTLALGDGGSISFSAGGRVAYSGSFFNGNVLVNDVRVDPRTQMPDPSRLVETEVQIWVNFLFDPKNEHMVRKLGEGISIPVLPFLEESLRKVEKIIEELKPVIARLSMPRRAPQ